MLNRKSQYNGVTLVPKVGEPMREGPLVLSVDVGTTNLKAGVVAPDGQVYSVVQQELPLLRDETGAAEHDPETLWNTFCTVAAQAAQPYRERIAALVLSAYQLSLLAVDAQGTPLTRIVTLLDTRPQQTYPRLLQRIDAHQIYHLTGCPPLFHYPLSKLFWLQQQHAEVFKQARWFVGAKEYLLHRLCGGWATEASLATATQLMNLHTLEWEPEICRMIGIDIQQLPSPVPAQQSLGPLLPEARSRLGLAQGCQVVPGVYDGGAVAIGIGALLPETGAINMGTTAMIRAALPHPVLDADPSMRLQTCYLAADRWFPGGAINNAGVTLRWLRDQLLGIDYDTMNREAASVPDTAGLYFLPFLSGERNPQIGNQASGVYFGLRAYHSRAHLVRATMEGVCFALRVVYDALRDNGVMPQRICVGGGGARSPLWMQTLANVLQTPLYISTASEPGLVGSAILGYTALGAYPDVLQATQQMAHLGEQFTPEPNQTERLQNRYRFFRQLMSDLAGVFAEHARVG